MPAAIGLAGIILFRRVTNQTGTIASLLSIALVIISIPFILQVPDHLDGKSLYRDRPEGVIQDGLMSQALEQVELINIEQVNVERPNLVAMLCGLGTVGVKPGGRELRLRGISHPRDLADMILFLRWEANIRKFEIARATGSPQPASEAGSRLGGPTAAGSGISASKASANERAPPSKAADMALAA